MLIIRFSAVEYSMKSGISWEISHSISLHLVGTEKKFNYIECELFKYVQYSPVKIDKYTNYTVFKLSIELMYILFTIL